MFNIQGICVRNPTIYVFLWETRVREEVLRCAERTHPADAVFELNIDNIRSTKARIQANEGGLNLSRVNVYAVVSAENPQGAELVESAGKKIRTLFREDFAAVDMTLAVILNESNEECDLNFEERNAATYKFLMKLAERDSFFNRIFLLSDKNEYGEVLPTGKKNICEIVAALPLLNLTQSHFNEIIESKIKESGRMLFASAGFWQKPLSQPSHFADNRALHKFAEILEKEMEDEAEGLAGKVRNGELKHSLSEIIKNISSVAAKPLRIWNLWGRSVKEAEILLYGNEAEKFFKKHYLCAYDGEAESPIIPEKMPLQEVAATEKQLQEALLEIKNTITLLTDSIAETSISRIKLFQTIDYIKTKIGEYYALRFELQNINVMHDRLMAEHGLIKSYLEHIRDVIKNLKALPIEEPPEKNTAMPSSEDCEYLTTHAETLAPIAISLLRNDGLISEQHILPNTDGEIFLLRIIGGFTLKDLSRRNAMQEAAAIAK